jgi:general secretion pathway protein B
VSYIYDALKRAERDNQRRGTVTLRSTEPAGPPRRSRWWLWVLIGALAANAGALAAFVVMRQPRPVETSPVASKPAPVVAAPSAPPVPAPVAPKLVTVVEAPKAAVPAEPPKVTAATSTPKAVPAPVVKPERAFPRQAPPATAKPVLSRESAAMAPTSSAPPPAVAAAPTTPVDGPKLTLQVIAYSEVAAERMVFIDGRRYSEGDSLDAETVLQRIRPDSIVVNRRGQEFVIADRPR